MLFKGETTRVPPWYGGTFRDEFSIPPACAERFFWCQVLAGDSTDGIEEFRTGMVTAAREVSKWDIEKPLECWEKLWNSCQERKKRGTGNDNGSISADPSHA